MTKKELTLAQALHVAHDAASRQFESEYWTTRQPFRDLGIDSCLGAIVGRAREAFFSVTGRFPGQVNMTDLNTDHPAEWARKHKPGTYDDSPDRMIPCESQERHVR